MNRKRPMPADGGMPFALIAVTLLMLCSVYGVVNASIERNTEITDSITGEPATVSSAAEQIRKMTESNIGSIINDISTSGSGTLIERTSSFDSILDGWMGSQFPMVYKGVDVSLIGYDIGLTIENARLSGDESPSRISFLKAKGDMTVQLSTSSISETRIIDISADGTSGLPFVTENMTRFELSSSGGSSILTELMSYQLSTLAQIRVMNGYGSISQYGEYGTEAIITADDVKRSFRESLSVIETVCFRCNGEGDGTLISGDRVDAAELFVLEDGMLEIDLSSILSQALIAAADQIVVKWMDLFWAPEILDCADALLDGARNIDRTLRGLFADRDLNSAVPYIVGKMEDRGISDYRYVESKTMILEIPSGTVDIDDWYGFKEDGIGIDGFAITVSSPEIDILSWNGWDGFVMEYTMGRNDIREYMRNTLHTAALASMSDAGAVRIRGDAFDEEDFSALLSRTFDEALRKGLRGTEENIRHTIDIASIPDPMYQAMYEKLAANKDRILNIDSVRMDIREAVKEGLTVRFASEGKHLPDGIMETVTDSLMSLPEIETFLGSIASDFEERMCIYRDVLTDVRKDNLDYVKLVLAQAFDFMRDDGYIEHLMVGAARSYIDDLTNSLRMNASSGIMDISGGDSFILTDNGTIREEFLSIAENADISVMAKGPNGSKCIHMTDADRISFTPYTTVFSFRIDAEVEYRVESSTAVLKALGWHDTVSDSSFGVHADIDVACYSGWGLAGISYMQSRHISDYILDALGEVLEPLLEPLEEIYRLLKELFTMCSTAIVEINAYVQDLIMRFYEAAERPVELLQTYIEDGLLGILEKTFDSFDIGLGYQSMTFCYAGMSLVLETRLTTLKNSTKTICKITLSDSIGDTDIKVTVEVKHSEKNGLMLRGTGAISGEDWSLKLMLDPLMKFSKKMLTVSGVIRDVAFSADIPYIVQYDEIEAKVSDVPGIGDILSNIPVPIPGMKGSVDLGIFLKYDLPMSAELVINEFESNPEGTDRGNEWVEIYNGSLSSIDLTGYTLVPGSDESKAITLEGKISPMGRQVFTFQSQSLNNSKTKSGNGEMLTLFDADGNEVDSTPWKADSYNDDRTWQRTSDGGNSWTLSKGSKAKSNGTILGMNTLTENFVLESLKEAGDQAFYEMGNHLRSLDDIAEFLHRMVEIFIEKVIEKIADIIIAAGVFISLELTDLTESEHTGLRISLEMNSDLVKDGLTWLLSQIPLLSEFVETPSCSDPLDIVCNDTYFRTVAYTGISAPRIINRTGEEMQVTMGISAAVNISGMFTVFGKERGIWKAEIGLVIEDCPFALMPKRMQSSNGEKGDLWLIHMTFSDAKG